jgi:hypothetical protein
MGIDWDDEALASAYRDSLTLCGAVLAYRDDEGVVVYEKANTFPILPPNGPGSDAYNRHLRQLADEEDERTDAAVRAARENSPEQRQRAELLALLDERIVEHVESHIADQVDELMDARFDDLAERLEHTVDRGTIEKIRALLRKRNATQTTAESGTRE